MSVAEKQKAKRKTFVMQAMPLIREKGYANVTVDDICSFVGISKGTFYHYFDDKEAFIEAVYQDVNEFFAQELIPYLDMENTEKALKAYAEYAQKNGVELARTVSITLSDNKNLYDILYQIISNGQNYL